LLFVGSGWERKGLRFVLQAMVKLSQNHPEKSIKLLVAGKGRVPVHIPANTIFAGPMADVENAYAAADLLVFPPIYEPSSNVVIEALAAGLPVITSACNGASEWIQEGDNGNVLARPDDVEAMVEKVLGWRSQNRRITADLPAMSLERNLNETIAVLEQAAQERPA
jgi:UDP-glucose:(heptosyl)LPS alpha-1,3-glucosyltransferase